MYDIPILFIIFNRLEISLQAFEKIKMVEPSKLYIASDGARISITNEDIIVKQVRESVISKIDWNCEIKTLFQEKNLGCSLGVYTAINWLFENEEMGIILEDDCVVSKSFFSYMDILLKQYKDENRIGMIAGHNQLGIYKNQSSYVFSKYKACWGWATWRRAWKNMDYKMQWRLTSLKNSVIINMGYKGKDYNYWIYRLKLIDKRVVSAWDWQWYFSLSVNNQLCIFPAKNLVSNIGFGKDATHTSIFGKIIKSYEIEIPLMDNKVILPDYEFDRLFFKKNNTLYNSINQIIPIWLKQKIKKFVKIIKG